MWSLTPNPGPGAQSALNGSPRREAQAASCLWDGWAACRKAPASLPVSAPPLPWASLCWWGNISLEPGHTLASGSSSFSKKILAYPLVWEFTGPQSPWCSHLPHPTRQASLGMLGRASHPPVRLKAHTDTSISGETVGTWLGRLFPAPLEYLSTSPACSLLWMPRGVSYSYC